MKQRPHLLMLLLLCFLAIVIIAISFFIRQQQETQSKAASTTCTATGGSGGTTISAPGIILVPGNGGNGSSINGVCKPGTNAYSLDASAYCTGHSILITWPVTNTATYYKLLIDGVRVTNRSALSFNARNYSVGPQHTVTLYAGNATVGDFNPSIGGYFQIQSTACASPTATPTSIPPTATPTVTLTPTPVPNLTLFFTIFLHNIGNSGDSQNPNVFSLSNKNPLTPTRNLIVTLFDNQGIQKATDTITMTFNGASGNFQGSANLGNVPSGTYTIKVKTDKYLRKQIPGFITYTSGQTPVLPNVTLVAGDTNNDNALNILDYTMIIDCYSGIAPAKNCVDPSKKSSADLNDEGNVNQIDYNLLLRELSVQSGD